jgi:hypothetical protein
MGFNKRFVDREIIMENLENDWPLSKLFSSDALIFLDNFSTKIYEQYAKGIEDNEIKNLINDGELRK